jgi:hypothetical protein
MASLPVARKKLSATGAARDAIALMRRRLFPFQFDRWFALGFVAFLEQCGRTGGVNIPGGVPGGGDGGSGIDQAKLSEVTGWMGGHIALIVGLAALVLALIAVFMAVLLWLNSRGVFMYLDNVASGRSDIARPWREHRERASSYFAWSFGAALLGLVGTLLLIVPILLAGLSMLTNGGSTGSIVAMLVSGLSLMLFIVVLSLFSLLLRDFAAPLQLHLNVSCGRALALAWGLVLEHKGAFALYVVLKIVFAMAGTLAGWLVGCVTCCLGFLPVVLQTLLQPLLYFERAWSLFLLRQAGHDLFAVAATPTRLPSSGLDP